MKRVHVICAAFLALLSMVPSLGYAKDARQQTKFAKKTQVQQKITIDPELTPCNIVGTADYVIVGAGAAGTVVAARLADAGYSVILLEAGPDTSWQSTNPNVQCDIPNIETPAFAVTGQFGICAPPTNTNCGSWHATQTLGEFISPDQNGAYYVYPRGFGAGGSTSHHDMQDGIGSLQVYDNIAAVVQDNYWLGANIQKLFQKMEKVSFSPSGQCGAAGWLGVRQSPVEPLAADITNAVVATGVPFRQNFCDPQKPDGIGNAQMQATPDGLRSYSYQNLLVPIMQKYPGRVQVVFDTLAAEIIIQNVTGMPGPFGNKYKAVGVRAYNKAYLQQVQPGGANSIVCPTTDCSADPTQCVALSVDRSLPDTSSCYIANREVIVSGGAIQSPQLLMLSGIGPKRHLQSVGIQTKVDLPGVGSDLLDHCEVNVLYNINPQVFVPAWQAFYLSLLPKGSLDPKVAQNVAQAMKRFPDNVFTTDFSQTQWDWYSSGHKEVVPGEKYPFPDVHSIPYTGFFFNWDSNFAGNLPQYPSDYFTFPTGNNLPDPLDPLNQTGLPNKADFVFGQYGGPLPGVYLDWLVENMKPTVTNGTIRLASSDPRVSPIIHEQLYEDDAGIENIAKMIMQIRDVMNTPAIKNKYSIPGQPWELFPGPSPDVADVNGLKQYIKLWSSFGHHIAGTCQMGARNSQTGQQVDPNSVLDARCRVFGVDNLRVADTSVYVSPWLHAFNTSRAAYVVGEAVADFIINNK